MALRTGVSIIVGSSAALALGFVVSQWRKQKPLNPQNSLHPTAPAKDLDTREDPDKSVPIHIGPIVSDPDGRIQDLDGGVSARPAERWQDNADYDPANPDDLGAVYLTRAVQAYDADEVSSDDVDTDGLHIEISEWNADDEPPDGLGTTDADDPSITDANDQARTDFERGR